MGQRNLHGKHSIKHRHNFHTGNAINFVAELSPPVHPFTSCSSCIWISPGGNHANRCRIELIMYRPVYSPLPYRPTDRRTASSCCTTNRVESMLFENGKSAAPLYHLLGWQIKCIHLNKKSVNYKDYSYIATTCTDWARVKSDGGGGGVWLRYIPRIPGTVYSCRWMDGCLDFVALPILTVVERTITEGGGVGGGS